jgi:hypothetical protein
MQVPKIFAPPHPQFPSRRAFLARAGNGMGLLALSGLLGQSASAGPSVASAVAAVNPLAPRVAHFPVQGQERHLAVHERRALPRRHVGLQA